MPHQPDHITAVQHGGRPAADNLALACCDCNLLKGPNIASVDPESGRMVRLFHPRRDKWAEWAEHFRLEAGHILGITANGRATAFLLQFNAPDRVRQRAHLMLARRYPG